MRRLFFSAAISTFAPSVAATSISTMYTSPVVVGSALSTDFESGKSVMFAQVDTELHEAFLTLDPDFDVEAFQLSQVEVEFPFMKRMKSLFKGTFNKKTIEAMYKKHPLMKKFANKLGSGVKAIKAAAAWVEKRLPSMKTIGALIKTLPLPPMVKMFGGKLVPLASLGKKIFKSAAVGLGFMKPAPWKGETCWKKSSFR